MDDAPAFDYDRLDEILMPSTLAAYQRAYAGIRFVHYTSAQAAYDILKSNCMWMRNATCMNDYNEMRHGLTCLIEAFQTEAGEAFRSAIDQCYAGLSAELDAAFTAHAPRILEHTYITCVSEHSDDEELYGRLSMWRAFGSTAGVALVFNSEPFVSPSDALMAWCTPVTYINAEGFKGEIIKVAGNIARNIEFLQSMPKAKLLDCLLRTLIFAVVSSKHEGFKEEREWRIVHFPTIWPAAIDRLMLDQVCLGGVPQPVFKIPFVNHPEFDFTGVSIPEIVNHVIVGPTQYQVATRTALGQMLSNAGVENASDRVRCSNVTLRL